MTKALFVVRGGEYFPPVGVMQISAIAEQAGHEVGIGVLSKEDVFKKIERQKPDVVAYTGSTGEHKLYFKFNNELKKRYPELRTIMGGSHATFFPEGTLVDGKMDAVCIGEGDYAFLDILNNVGKGRSLNGLENVMTSPDARPGLRPLVQNLDSLPFPKREMFYDYGESGNNPIKHFFATRGCPFNCTYCFNEPFRDMYNGQRYVRRRSIDNLLEEIKKVQEKWPLKYIKFYDDVFALKADSWLEEFAKKYPAKIGLPFFCLMRADHVTEDMADLLKTAGCKAVSLSIETANPKLRENVLKRKMSNEKLKDCYKLMGEKGLTVQSNNILGLPGSTIEDDIASVDFNIECGSKQNTRVMAEFGTAHPYPGTALFEYCKKKGFYDTRSSFSNLHMSYHDESPLECFSKMEKRMQRNLTMLGTVAVRFPWLRNVIMNRLIKLPPNPLYFFAFYLTKTTGYMKHVYPIGYTASDYLRVISQSLKLDWFKRMEGEKWKKS